MSLHDKELHEGAESNLSGFRGSEENVPWTPGTEFKHKLCVTKILNNLHDLVF